MRIAVVNWSRRRVGGTETYLSHIIPELLRLGHAVSFWYERDEPENRAEIQLPEGVAVWCVKTLGAGRALRELRQWRPDLIYNHSLHDVSLEAEVMKIAPAVFFAHTYYGTCISGAKTFKSPVVRPCERSFSWKCLALYYPRRCGGLSPLTMGKLYLEQSKRLVNLGRYDAIVTHSDHMAEECMRHGIDGERIHNLSYYTHVRYQPPPVSGDTTAADVFDHSVERSDASPNPWNDSAVPLRLLFLGRMDRLKGGAVLLDALREARTKLGRPLHTTFAGDGPARLAWEAKARRVETQDKQLSVEFTGWVKGERSDHLLKNCELLVFPSLWPEPFGLTGLEAGKYGVPVAAFAVGGIPNWLRDGVNGSLAPSDPPTPSGLAESIYQCLHDSSTYARLRLGAFKVSEGFRMEHHVSSLIRVFESVLNEGRPLRH